MLEQHYVEIQNAIMQAMVYQDHFSGRRDFDRCHAIIAVDLKSKIGPQIIQESKMVSPDHKWATDMPVLSMCLKSARDLFGSGSQRGLLSRRVGRKTAIILSRPPAPGHIHVVGVGDNREADRQDDGMMAVVGAMWPTPEIDWANTRLQRVTSTGN